MYAARGQRFGELVQWPASVLTYRELPPPARLAPYVRCFWTLEGRSPAAPERILPDGSFELVFHLGDPFRQDGIAQPRALLIGQLQRPTLVQPPEQPRVLGVRFHAGGAAPFFRLPMHELRDVIVPAADFLPGVERVLDEGLGEGLDGIARMLLRRLSPPAHEGLVRAAASLLRRRPSLRIRALAEHLGVSERTLQRRFEACTGLLPKTYARLMRFQSFVAAPDGDAGYVDDAHLARDFHDFAGITPARFLREQHAICDNFVGNVQEPEGPSPLDCRP
jgi:AraC-like DNA-binding protein